MASRARVRPTALATPRREEGDPTAWHDWQTRRIVAWGRLLVLVMSVLMVGVLVRVVQLKVQPDPRIGQLAGSPESTRREPARRGDLLDRRGRVIASSTMGHRLFVDPVIVEDLQTIAVDIAGLIGGDPVTIDRRLAGRETSRYVVVNDLLEGWQVDAIRHTRLRGVGLAPRLVRHYPAGSRAARVVGMVGFEHSGLSGLEHRFDRRMGGTPGRLTYLRDAASRPLWIEPAGYEARHDGENVRLSLDLVIQEIAEERLAQAVESGNAGGGRVVVMDCRTGEILAMHDILNPRAGWEEQTTDDVRAKSPALGRNRCLTDPYEPGSTFKPFVWAAATDQGLAEPDEVLPTPTEHGFRTSFGRLIRDSHYHGPSTWREVLLHSLNSGMSIVAERMSHDAMQRVLRSFCFGERSGSGVPGESPGLVTPAAQWTAYTQTSVSFGHEICVTPLQMVRAFSAFARDGTIPTPRFTAVASEERDYRFVRRAVRQAIALETRTVMRGVIDEGTGRRARSSLYSMFGKSGTAQLPKAEGGGYHEHRYVSSFIAGAPFDEPRVVVLCVIDDPDRKKGHWGGAVAGPVVRDVIDGALRYLGVPADLPSESHEDAGTLASNQ